MSIRLVSTKNFLNLLAFRMPHHGFNRPMATRGLPHSGDAFSRLAPFQAIRLRKELREKMRKLITLCAMSGALSAIGMAKTSTWNGTLVTFDCFMRHGSVKACPARTRTDRFMIVDKNGKQVASIERPTTGRDWPCRPAPVDPTRFKPDARRCTPAPPANSARAAPGSAPIRSE